VRALVYHGSRDVRIEERPAPELVPGSVVVEVTRCGICGTDATEYVKGPVLLPSTPTVLGHEFIGVVHESVDSRWPVDTRVASGAGVWCGKCPRCLEGRTNLCDLYETLGLTRDGGLATYVLAPSRTLHGIPDGLPEDLAALAQPLAVGLHAVTRAEVRSDDVVVLLGAGAIGSFVLLGLLGRACGPVVVADVVGERLAAAKTLGADHVVLVEDSADVVRELTGGRGADIVIETSGAPGALQRAVDLARRGGRVQAVGLPGPQPINVTSMVLREVDVSTSVAHVCDRDLPAALALLDERRPVLPTTVIGLADTEAEGLIPLAEGRSRSKILVDPRR
jgi:(R,R)-butanediol dehydrogenase/meso-butanediol dehydrogenase/diacetyl reductase